MTHIDFKRAPTVGVEDLVLLQNLSDKSISEDLKLRYNKDLIYTAIGSVLISVNPFKRLPIYTEEQIQYYRTHGKTTTTPHIFNLAEDTYRTMILEEENQCVIISGESGAGKTEASKQIMQYIAAVSGNSKEMQRVKQIMLESNPLLEAFGNAKTVRNDNSSRFGKFFEIYFDRVGGPLGGHMSNFLLEKSRVVRQQKGERSFHIFYQLCCGCQDPIRSKLRLRPPTEFHFLNQGGTVERTGVSDEAEWKETVDAMDAMGIPDKDQESVFQMLAAILHLGELTFTPNAKEEFSASDRDEMKFVSELLEVDAAQLERCLTWKKLEMGSETVNVPLDLQQCNNARDALAKSIYDKLFNFIVESVNIAFGKKPFSLMLGVLDIYGFEIFEKNGFEQFCINYVNEKLQQIFIELTLKVEQEEYVREKIAWEPIKYFNNKIVCDLIEGKQPPGLFAIIDDVCAAMAKEVESVADVKMLDKLDGAFGQHPHFHRTDQGFMIKHYAGDVHYNSQGFTTRNKDLLSVDILTVVITTQNQFFQRLLEDVEVEVTSPTQKVGARKKATTAGYKIRTQAADLIKTLMLCNPHYVRTVKPNDEKRANFYDDPRVLHQVKYLGLLENVRVRRAGFSYRQYYDKFLKRFKYCCPATFPRPFSGSDKNACKTILEYCSSTVPEGAYQLGETKIFIRQPQHLFAMEDRREASFDKIVLKVQRAWTRFRNNREYIVLKKNMDRIYAKASKERRSDSVFRPFLGQYLNYHSALAEVHPLIEFNVIASAWKEGYSETGKRYYFNCLTQATSWEKPIDMEKQRILFTDRVDRIVNHQGGQTANEILVVSDRALYFVEAQQQTVVTPPTKPTKANPHPPPPPAPYTYTMYVLKKRLDVRLLAGVSVSLLADPYCVVHFYPAPVPYRPVTMAPMKGTTHCQSCGVKFTPALKRANCPGCGLMCCLKTCLVYTRPFPTLGQPKPVKCCARCVVGEPHEAVEDVVICNVQKTEIVAMIRKVYKRLMGNKIPINCNNNIEYQLAGEARKRVLSFLVNNDLKEATLFQNNGQLVVHVPKGISQVKIAEIEKARDERSRIAQERHRKELEEQKVKEIEKDKEREEARRQQVEERKRMKREAEERAETDRMDRERAARERREQNARVVAEKSTK